MKWGFVLVVLFSGLSVEVIAQTDPVKTLSPGQGFRLAFDDLPATLFATKVNPDIPTAVFGRIPDNYSPDKKFPLCVYLSGGWGGAGDNTQVPLSVVGKSDYIVVNFPLFRKEGFDRASYIEGMVVGFDDYQAISSAYDTILKRLQETIPNIDIDRSILGGHSNGAKTIAVLLSAMDQPTLENFRGFFLIDGGFDWTSLFRTHELKDHHILFVAGGGHEGQSDVGRQFISARMAAFRHFAKTNEMVNWQFMTMPGHGHEFAPEYFPLIREWAARVGGTR